MAYVVAVVGATGAVGVQMIKMLEASTLPIEKVRLLASSRSAGKTLQFKGQEIIPLCASKACALTSGTTKGTSGF